MDELGGVGWLEVTPGTWFEPVRSGDLHTRCLLVARLKRHSDATVKG